METRYKADQISLLLSDQNANCKSMSNTKYEAKKVLGLQQLGEGGLRAERERQIFEESGEGGGEGRNTLVTGKGEVCGHTEPAPRSFSLTRPGIPEG